MGGLTESSDYPRPCTALVFSTKLVCPDQKNRRDHRWRRGFRYFFQGASPEPRSLSDSAQYFHSSLSLSAASLLVLPLPRQKEKDPRETPETRQKDLDPTKPRPGRTSPPPPPPKSPGRTPKETHKDTLPRPGPSNDEGGQNLGQSDLPDSSLLAVLVTTPLKKRPSHSTLQPLKSIPGHTPRRLCIRTLDC